MIVGFKKRHIGNKLSLGRVFRKKRIKKGSSLKQVAKETLIRLAYLKDLEKNNFKDLPNEPYGSFFVKKYALFLGLNTKEMVLWYQREINVLKQNHELKTPQELHFSFFSFLRSKFRLILLGLFLIATVFSFMAYEVAGMAKGPKLSVIEPSKEQMITKNSLIVFKGVTDEEASIDIDGELASQEGGSFSQEVILAKGMNKIEITATDNSGKTTTKVFNILRE